MAVYLHNWRVAVVVDWKLGLGSGHCVSRHCRDNADETYILLGSVMGLCPILLNMLQFWLIDSIVKASDSLGLTNALTPPEDESQEPLFMNEPDSEGEDRPVWRQGSADLEGGYRSPTKGTTTHSRTHSPSSLSRKLDKESTATKLDELERNASGKSRTSVEFQQPSAARRSSPPPSPHYGATEESTAGWGGFEEDLDWEGEHGGAWGGAGKQRSPKLGTGRRSLSVGGRKSSGGSGSWRLDTLSPSRDQATR
jgi:hypothetical protein